MKPTVAPVLQVASMIHPRKLIDYISAEPFRPFRIKMASDLTLDIRHPEMIEVGRSSARVFITSDDDPGKHHWKDVSLMLMETVEPLQHDEAAKR